MNVKIINRLKPNRKGFSLVEMLVCIAILAIISVTVIEFISTSGIMYKKIANTTVIQNEVEQCMTKIGNVIRNTQNITVQKYTDGSVKYVEILSINGELKYDKIIYRKSSIEPGILYYCADYNNTIKPDIANKEYILAENLQEFDIEYVTYFSETSVEDPSHAPDAVKYYEVDGDTVSVIDRRAVNVSIAMEKQKREFEQTLTFSVRSKHEYDIIKKEMTENPLYVKIVTD